MSYKSSATPTSLVEALDVIEVMQEYLQRQTTVQVLDDSGESGGDTKNPVLVIKAQGQTKVGGKVPKIGDLTVMLGATVRSNSIYKLTTDFVPTQTNDALLLVSDGRTQLEVARAGEVGQSVGCPFIINEIGDPCNPVLRVEGDTEENLLYIRGDNNRIGIGMIPDAPFGVLQIDPAALGGLVINLPDIGAEPSSLLALGNSGFDFAIWVQGDHTVHDVLFAVQSSSQEIHFGDRAPAGGQECNFNMGVQFTDRIVYRRTATAIDYVMVDTDFYVGVTDTSVVRLITLPKAGGASGSDGRMVIVKDEGGNATAAPITVQADAGDTVDGTFAVSIGANYGALNFTTDGGTKWFSH